MSQPAETTRPLSPDERRRLLAQMLQERAGRSAERPLSLGQERLGRMSRLEPESSRYTLAVAYRTRGPLDVGALERGVRTIAGRHEVLRAAFPAGGDRPTEIIGPDPPPVFSVSD